MDLALALPHGRQGGPNQGQPSPARPRCRLPTHRGCLLLCGLGCKPSHVVDDGREVGGAVEADVRQASRVCLGDAVHTCLGEKAASAGSPQHFTHPHLIADPCPYFMLTLDGPMGASVGPMRLEDSRGQGQE